MKTKKKEWKSVGITGNVVLNGRGFFISYNPDAGTNVISSEIAGLANILAPLIGISEKPRKGAETALVLKTGKDIFDREYFILNGDYRDEYEKAFPSLKKCREVYDLFKSAHRSDWSTDDDEDE